MKTAMSVMFTFIASFGLLCTCVAYGKEPELPGTSGGVYRAFTDDSYWNTPIPADAPRDPNSDKMIAFLRQDSRYGYIKFTGLGPSGAWGRPIYWGYASDPVETVDCQGETYAFHIPDGAKADPTSDAASTVYDMASGLVFGLHGNPGSMTCSSVHYLSSSGLDRKWTQFSDTHSNNVGHRGAPASNIGIRIDEIEAGEIRHKLHLSVNTSKDTHVFPMVGDENGTSNADAPPEGALIRIKPDVDLDSRGLSRSAKIVATALQKYGAIVGDQNSCCLNLKVENTIAEGTGNLWEGVLEENGLSNISIEDYEFIELGYGCGDDPLCYPVEQK